MSLRQKLALSLLLISPLVAQPLLDNPTVRVVKAVDQPHHKGQLHEHKMNRVMIYLQPGTQDIKYQDGHTVNLSWKAGEVKWSPASGMHTSEVTSDATVNIIELELKNPGDASKKVDTPLDPLKVDPADYKLEFENPQVRVTRVKIGAHKKVPEHEHVLNRVVVYLTDQNGSMTTPDGKTENAQHHAGEASWGGPVKHREENLMDKPFEAVVVDFK